MKSDKEALSEEYRQQAAIEEREEERYQQAQDDYEWQVAHVPLRVDYDDDTSYDEAIVAWADICQTLLDRVKELQRTT